jgi:two-component system, response regulator PdtaR
MAGSSVQLYPRNEPQTGCTILVVEDEVLVRMMIADQLRSAGYNVIEAAEAHEASQVLRHAADVRLVISDIQMSGSMDGVALARLIRSQYPGTKIILTSGHFAAIDWADHDGLFHKPYDVSKIIRHIKPLLD